ncbi:MAG: PQQ-binding-like beta-propeller repeat protein [Verrucomicrobiota bacterium]
MKQTILSLALTSLLAAPLQADDWPSFRGPKWNGVSAETGWKPWSGEPDIAWTKELGIGASSFAVVGNQVFTTGNKDGTDFVYCLDPSTGEEIWTYPFQCEFESRMFDGGTASTPSVYKGKVYNLSYDGQFQCLDQKSGRLLWDKHMLKDFNGDLSRWKYAGSPLVIGNRVILDIGGRGNSTLALDATTGSKIWGSGDRSAGYASPVPFRQGKRPAVLVFKGKHMIAVDFQSGNELWDIPWKTSYDVNASSPVVIGDKFFMSSGYGGGRGALFQLNGGQPEKLWQNDDIKTKMNSCVAYGPHVYGISEKKGVVMCMDQTNGNTVWDAREGGQFGTLMIAGGKLIILTDGGTLKIADASPDGYNELASADVLNGTCWVMPVLANGRIYAKNNKGRMVCIKL